MTKKQKWKEGYGLVRQAVRAGSVLRPAEQYDVAASTVRVVGDLDGDDVLAAAVKAVAR